MRYIERLERIIRDQKKAELLALAKRPPLSLAYKHFDQALRSWDQAFLRMLVARNAP